MGCEILNAEPHHNSIDATSARSVNSSKKSIYSSSQQSLPSNKRSSGQKKQSSNYAISKDDLKARNKALAKMHLKKNFEN